MEQLRQQSIERLKRVKRWQWVSLLSFAVLSCLVTIDIHTTKFSDGFWGILDDEIAVVTIESDKGAGKQNITVKDPSKSFWDILGILGVPLVLAVLGAWFQKTQQEQSERIAKKRERQDGDETREEVLQTYFDRISTLLIDKSLMAIAAKKEAFDEIKKEGSSAKVVSSYDFTQKELTASIPAKIDRYVEGGDDRGLNDLLGFSKQEQELLEVSIDVIRARTLSILRRFEQDSERKSSVIRFLVEADVIARLRSTSLSSAYLSRAYLSRANLSRANLSGANLSGADLSGAA